MVSTPMSTPREQVQQSPPALSVSRRAELVKQFASDMQPETVLFLRRLQSILLMYPQNP